MRIAFISVWFSEGMGYAENFFPKAMAKHGAEVHLVTSTAQIYYYLPNYDKVYEPYLGPKFVNPGTKEIDGYSLHRLPFQETRNVYQGPGMIGLYQYLEKLKPDVIQTFEILLESSYIAAKYARDNHCLFFTECHTHASVFRTKGRKSWKEYAKRVANACNPKLGLINRTTSRCYPIAKDVAQIARTHYHVPKDKLQIQSLGVDTSTFYPPQSEEERAQRKMIRARFSFADQDIVCIYTGRFTRDKNPLCLARAIALLQERGLAFRGLFIGNGTAEDIESIQSQQGCQIGAFVPSRELPAYYWAADIGVWPREESTSQLDAAACGLPLILSNKIEVRERVNGNGLLYEEGDVDNLAYNLEQLADRAIRMRKGRIGIENVTREFSWASISKQRLSDYELFAKQKSFNRR